MTFPDVHNNILPPGLERARASCINNDHKNYNEYY